jgi:hypothetical protein
VNTKRRSDNIFERNALSVPSYEQKHYPSVMKGNVMNMKINWLRVLKSFMHKMILPAAAAVICPITCQAQTAPTITDQPVGAVVNYGGAVFLSAGVSGTSVNFQWLKNGVILPRQTNSSLSIDPFQFTNSGSYQVVASNAYGMAISVPASLSVPGAPLQVWGLNNDGQLGIGNTASQYSPVTVASNVVAVAAGVEYSLFVKNDGTLWSMGYNAYGELGNGDTATQTSPVQVSGLKVASLGGMDEAFHSMAVTLSAPQMVSAPQILPLTNQIVWLGRTVTFTLNVVNGTGPFTYQWQMSGTNLIGATNSSYTIASATFLDAGTYMGIVNGLGGSTTNSATLTVSISPLTNQVVVVGQPVIFTLDVTNGNGLFTYQWQKGGTNIIAATNSTYTIAAAGFSDAGVYTGIVNGVGGSASSSTTLTVAPRPPSLALTSSTLAGRQMLNLQVGGLAGSNYVLQVTTNLTPPAQWAPLQTNMADVNGACLFIVTNSPAPCLFYRIALP